jgi:hypothetical protein
VPVNADIPEPRSPGRWVTRYECRCGARYSDFRSGLRWSDGVQAVRQINGEGGGFRTRGPVLWALRCMKLDAWFIVHAICEQLEHYDNELTDMEIQGTA